jgi:hypothetical protein
MGQFNFILAIMTIFQLSGITTALADENTPLLDSNSIRTQAGCYEVTYQFTETLLMDSNYPFRSVPYNAKGTEWIDLDETNNEQEIILQHILLIPGGVIKHWSHKWVKNPEFLFEFQGQNRWAKKHFSPSASRGKWAQEVYQVDGSPRYGCAAPWVHWDNHHYWECQTWSPLPRREFTKRNDYDILDRRNRHEIYSWGWSHEQNNLKIKLEQNDPVSIAKEIGQDTYLRVADSRCEPARKWWQENKQIWNEIHHVWKDVYSSRDQIELKSKIDGMTLWERLFDFAESTATHPQRDVKETRKTIHSIIDEFLIKS